MTQHVEHQMFQLEGILKMVSRPLALPETHGRLEKGVETLIDSLIEELQQLKTKHRCHISQHLDKHIGDNALRKKLMQREALQKNEATGDCFFQLTDSLAKRSAIDSPYKLRAEEMGKQLAEIGMRSRTLTSQIELLWNPCFSAYTFSNTLKHANYTISQANRQADLTTTTTRFVVALVEPQLPLQTTSKIMFKIGRVGWPGVGVCYRSIVEKNGFVCQCTLFA